MKFGKLHGYHRHRGHQGQHNLHHRLLSLAVSILSGRASSPVVRYYGLYANAHRGKVKKASLDPLALRMVEEEIRRIPAKGWAALIRKPYLGLRSAAMIRKVYEVDPMLCPKCGGTMKVVAFLTEHAVVDRIIDHLKLTFAAAKPPPPEIAFQELLMAADVSAEYFS